MPAQRREGKKAKHPPALGANSSRTPAPVYDLSPFTDGRIGPSRFAPRERDDGCVSGDELFPEPPQTFAEFRSVWKEWMKTNVRPLVLRLRECHSTSELVKDLCLRQTLDTHVQYVREQIVTVYHELRQVTRQPAQLLEVLNLTQSAITALSRACNDLQFTRHKDMPFRLRRFSSWKRDIALTSSRQTVDSVLFSGGNGFNPFGTRGERRLTGEPDPPADGHYRPYERMYAGTSIRPQREKKFKRDATPEFDDDSLSATPGPEAPSSHDAMAGGATVVLRAPTLHDSVANVSQHDDGAVAVKQAFDLGNAYDNLDPEMLHQGDAMGAGRLLMARSEAGEARAAGVGYHTDHPIDVDLLDDEHGAPASGVRRGAPSSRHVEPGHADSVADPQHPERERDQAEARPYPRIFPPIYETTFTPRTTMAPPGFLSTNAPAAGSPAGAPVRTPTSWLGASSNAVASLPTSFGAAQQSRQHSIPVVGFSPEPGASSGASSNAISLPQQVARETAALGRLAHGDRARRQELPRAPSAVLAPNTTFARPAPPATTGLCSVPPAAVHSTRSRVSARALFPNHDADMCRLEDEIDRLLTQKNAEHDEHVSAIQEAEDQSNRLQEIQWKIEAVEEETKKYHRRYRAALAPGRHEHAIAAFREFAERVMRAQRLRAMYVTQEKEVFQAYMAAEARAQYHELRIRHLLFLLAAIQAHRHRERGMYQLVVHLFETPGCQPPAGETPRGQQGVQ